MSGIDPNRSGVLVVGGGGASLSDATPQPTGTAAAGVSTSAARADHVHAASVAAADITDAGAAGVTVLQAATAAAVRTAIAAAERTATTYDFSSATGVTLTNGSAGGTAAVSGGVLALTCPATPEARYYGGLREAPLGSVALPLVDGRFPLRWRATARLASTSSSSVPRFLAKNAFGTTFYAGFYIAADGTIGAENNTTGGGYAVAGAGSLPTNGTGWLEIECSGDLMVFRYGTGTTSTEPSTWTILAAVAVSATVLGTIELVNSTNGVPGSTKLVEWDDLTVSSW